MINNYFVKGPSTGSGSPFIRGNQNFHLHASGNYHGDDIGADGYSTVERYLNGLVPASS